MLPRALLLTWAGTHAADLYTALMEGNLPFEWLLALVVVSFGAGTFIIYRALKRSPDSKANTTDLPSQGQTHVWNSFYIQFFPLRGLRRVGPYVCASL